jgi:hypothetical protein
VGAVIEFEVFRDSLGVAATDPEVDAVSLLFNAINAEIRRLTHRAFEGDGGGSYDQVIRIRGEREFTLPWGPVASITSIARVHFDATEDDPYETTDWRLEDADRGRVLLRSGSSAWASAAPFFYRDHRRGGPEYVHVIWTTTGEIPAQLPQACLEWGKSRWDSRDRDPAMASYQTGDDAESYFASLAGKPPHGVLLAIMGVAHLTGGGVV